ncbi:MAG: hypothetical protein JNK05_39825 [Myxococcales bacterium]|nr:hypothetical protein [Myxococcales bacterium]
MTTQGQGAEPPFERDEFLNDPGIIGARWWNSELKSEERQASRRQALAYLAIGLTVTAGVGGMVAAGAALSTKYERRSSLEMQRRFGWSFGANGERLTFDGRRVLPFDPAKLRSLRADCLGTHLASMQSAAIFDAIFHRPAESPGEDTGTSFQALDSFLLPVTTWSMGFAYRMGQTLARVLSRLSRRVAVIVDLNGPDAVAVAAGLADTHAPVWLLDHWPHPHGVVPAHMTLASAIFFQPRFAAANATRPSDAPPVFITDRARMLAYVDASDRFDNRFVPKLPAATVLESTARARDILYVAPSDVSTLDPDDVNPALVAYRTRGLSVRAITGHAFFATTYEFPAAGQDPIESFLQQSKLFYNGDAEREALFDTHYDFSNPLIEVPATPDTRAILWQPMARAVMPPPPTAAPLGSVEVVIQGSNTILGARFDRNGSWNRVSSSSSSWGG